MTSSTSWRDLSAAQQPEWPKEGLEQVVSDLNCRLPLVQPGEVAELHDQMALVAKGEAFVLQGGDCAEPFGWKGLESGVKGKLQVIFQMAVVLTYAAGVPVVKVGRMAGQFAKPRSSDTETRDGVTLAAYRGDSVNGAAFTAESRCVDPRRLLQAYEQSAATLNLIRGLTQSGFADLHRAHNWNQAFVAASPQGKRYEGVVEELEGALRFMGACGAGASQPALRQTTFYASHEALLLDYEAALIREDEGGKPYGSSAHMPWIGERTRQLDGAHVAFLASLANPIGVKLGPKTTVAEVMELCRLLNPGNIPGRLTFITRMGVEKIRKVLPPLLEAVREANQCVGWICDPMHGNTQTVNGYKTRRFDDVFGEVAGFFEVCRKKGTWPGGLHLELTGEDVTECLGGGTEIQETDLQRRYETQCDPRLNAGQSLDLAFFVAELLRQ